ncbi:MAG: ATP-binding protein, partial [Chloroflexota bacterium]
NALKHTHGAIQVSARADGQQVTIGVRDQGPGIDPATLEHVFDRFYRGDASAGIAGFGLGLPIAKALVEGQGGTITIESQPGSGSLVQLTLPRGEP